MIMATLYRHIHEYKEDKEWTQYIGRLENYFVANDVTDAAKKRAILFSVDKRHTNSFAV